jgi:hypothetical protein
VLISSINTSIAETGPALSLILSDSYPNVLSPSRSSLAPFKPHSTTPPLCYCTFFPATLRANLSALTPLAISACNFGLSACTPDISVVRDDADIIDGK